MIRTKICENLNDTYSFAENLAQELQAGDVIALYGNLGAGKTAFVQGIAIGLGYSEPVTSPTYSLWQIYEGGRLTIHHFDLYRLDTVEQVYAIGFYDAVDSDGVTLIEWPERLGDELPVPRINVYINRIDEEKRSICVEGLK